MLDDTGFIINDQTVKSSPPRPTHAEAGVDIVAHGSDMMDGRIGAIREALECKAIHTRIMAYSAKYASAFYGLPRRGGNPRRLGKADKNGTRWTRQQRRSPARSGPRHRRRRGHGDGQTRHAVPGHRARVKGRIRVPTFAYQVSGEYAMIKAAAAQNGWLDHDAVMMESLLAFKRAGADGRADLLCPRRCRLLQK